MYRYAFDRSESQEQNLLKINTRLLWQRPYLRAPNVTPLEGRGELVARNSTVREPCYVRMGVHAGMEELPCGCGEQGPDACPMTAAPLEIVSQV